MNVIGHELLHYVFSKNFKTDNESMKPLVDEFKKYLVESGNSAVLNRIENNMKENGYFDANGKIKDDYLEEYFQHFSNLIDNGEIELKEEKAKPLAKRFKDYKVSLGFGSIKLETGKDVFDFIKLYNKNIYRKGFFGKITQRAMLKADITTSIKGVEKADEKTRATRKKSITAVAKEAQETVDKIGKKATTKAEYDAGVNIEAYNYLIDKKGLDGLIIARLNKEGIDTKAEDANVNGVPLVDYMEDVRAKLIPDVLGFNPDKETTSEGKFGLSGYINQRLNFRMGDVATKAKKTVTGKSLETPIGETGRRVADIIEDKDDEGLKAFEEQDLSISAQNRATETEQDKNELKSRYRHKLKNNDGTKLISETRVEKIREGIRSTLIKLADKVVSPDFLFNFEKIVKKDLKNIVQTAIGAKKQYKDFVLKNMSDIVDFTSVQI